MEMPAEVTWLLPIVVGESWPEGDEDKLRALRDVWHAAAAAITPVTDSGNTAAREVLAAWNGDDAEAFDEFWKKFVDGDDAYLTSLGKACEALGKACDKTALDVEYTKYVIIASLVMLAIEIAAMVSASVVTLGASTAGIPAAQAATRITVQMIFRQLLQKLMQQGAKRLARELLEKFLSVGWKKLGLEMLKEGGTELALDLGIQGLQAASGDRKSWDGEKSWDALAGGAVGGAVSAGSAGLTKDADLSVGASAAKGAAEDVASTVGEAAVTGELGELSAGDLIGGASSGAVSGSMDRGGGSNAPDVDIAQPTTPDAGPVPTSTPAQEVSSDSAADPGPSGTPEAPAAASGPASSVPGAASSSMDPPETRSTTASQAASIMDRTDAGPGAAAPGGTPDAGRAASEGQPGGSGSAGPQPGSGGHGNAPPAGGAPSQSGQGGSGGYGAAPPRGGFGPMAPGGFGPAGGPPPGGFGPQGGPAPGFGPHGGPPPGPPTGPPPGGSGPSGTLPGPQASGGPPRPDFGPAGSPPPGGFGPAGPPHGNQPPHGPVPGPPTPPHGGPPPGNLGPPGGPRPEFGPTGPVGPPGGFGPTGTHPQRGTDGVTSAGSAFGAPPAPRQDGPPGPPMGPPVGPRGDGPPPHGAHPPRFGGTHGPPGRGQGFGPPRGPGRPAGPPPPQGPRPPHGPPPGQRGPVGPQGLAGPPRPPHPPANQRRPLPPPPPPRPGPPQPPPPRGRPGGPGPNPNPNAGRTMPRRAVDPGPWPDPGLKPPADKKVSREEQAPETSTPDTPTPATPAPDTADQARPDSRPPAATGTPVAGPESDSVPDTTDTEISDSDIADSDVTDGEPTDTEQDTSTEVPELSEDYLFDPDFRADKADFDYYADRLRGKGAGNNAFPNRFEELAATVRGRLAENPQLANGSFDNALAAHGYTTHDVFDNLNRYGRLGRDDFNQVNKITVEDDIGYHHTARAVVSAMNELPQYTGQVRRGISVNGNMAAADLAAAHYEPGRVVVETQFVSTSIVTDPAVAPKWPGEVEVFIESKTAANIAGLAQNPDEREALFKPSTQLLVESKERVELPPEKGKPRYKWVIHAREIVPGDPEYLDRDAAKENMAARREQAHAERDSGRSLAIRLDGDSPPPPDPPADQEKKAPAPAALSFDQRLNPGAGYSGAGDAFLPVGGDGAALPVADGGHDWSPLAWATNPPSEPAIHADSANWHQQRKYLAERHPDLINVNPGYYGPHAFNDGYQSNCTRAVEAYEQRMNGVDATAEPLRPGELDTKGTLDYVQQRLGGQWREHDGYDSVIRDMNGRADGARAIIGFKYLDADGNEFGHVATVVKTPEGVAFVDPQNGTLLSLPHPPTKVDLLPYHPPTGSTSPGENQPDGGYGTAGPPEDSTADHAGEDLADPTQRRPIR